MFFSNESIKKRSPDFGYLIRHYLSYTGCDNSHLNNLIGSSSSNVEGWTINVGFYQQNSHYQECYNNKSWHGYIGDDLIGSIKTILNGCGKAILDFGNCYKSGTTQVKLNGKVSLVMDSVTQNPIDFKEIRGHMEAFKRV